MTTPRFTEFDAGAFLRDTWQQHPLVIRNPWAEWRNPLEPDELAGLACEPGVESRFIEGIDTALAVEHGPLAEERFAAPVRQPWTLLVQAVDQHVPAVADLIEPFRFLPNWRIDDVMVSYAVTGGGVGPHFDQYDVFLVQGLGRRRWRVGGACDESTPLLPHDDLRLLPGFEVEHEWVLEPGDILYLPPGRAHDGVALSNDCMTYSIGFRAPSVAELTAAWCDEALVQLTEDDRYRDGGVAALQDNPGEITPAALDRLYALVMAGLGGRDGFARVFGSQATTPRYPEVDWSPEQPVTLRQLKRARSNGGAIERNPASRFAFIAQGAGASLLFVDGESQVCSGWADTCARALCGATRLSLDPAWPDEALDLVCGLINRGALALLD